MKTQQANAGQHANGFKQGRLSRFLSFLNTEHQLVLRSPERSRRGEGGTLSTLFALLTLLLAALAPRAEATWATGGTMTNYTDANGTNWIAHIFTSVGTTSLNFTAGGNAEVLVVAGAAVVVTTEMVAVAVAAQVGSCTRMPFPLLRVPTIRSLWEGADRVEWWVA